MEYYNYRPHYTSFGPHLSPIIKKLMIIMGVVFFLQLFTQKIHFLPPTFYPFPGMEPIFGLTPYLFWRRFFLWQPVTYMFLHGGLMHIIFNLFALWMFGSDLEYHWGAQFFMKYFLITGIGAGICTALFTSRSMIPTIGVSGAVYGILLAFGLTYPDRNIYLYFIFPIKAKYFALFFGLLEFYYTFSMSSSGIAHIAHLGGMVIGYIYLDYPNIFRKLKKWRNRKRFDHWNRWN